MPEVGRPPTRVTDRNEFRLGFGGLWLKTWLHWYSRQVLDCLRQGLHLCHRLLQNVSLNRRADWICLSVMCVPGLSHLKRRFVYTRIMVH